MAKRVRKAAKGNSARSKRSSAAPLKKRSLQRYERGRRGQRSRKGKRNRIAIAALVVAAVVIVAILLSLAHSCAEGSSKQDMGGTIEPYSINESIEGQNEGSASGSVGSRIVYERADGNHVAQDGSESFIDNEVLVVVRDGVKADEVDELASRYHASVVGCIELTGDYQLRFDEAHGIGELRAIVSRIAEEDEILSASINYVNEVRPQGVTYDVKWGNDSRWFDGLKDYGDGKGDSWGVEAVNAVNAWFTMNDHKNVLNPVKVGVIDHHFDSSCADLGYASIISNYADNNNHGTHVSGTMAARGDNEDGICGVYPYGNGLLYAASFKETEQGNTCMSEKVNFAELICKGARVINCSYGCPAWVAGVELFGFDNYRSDVGQLASSLGLFFQRLLDHGYDFVICCAAGNDSDDQFVLVVDDENGEDYKYSADGIPVSVEKRWSGPFSQGWFHDEGDGNYTVVNGVRDEYVKSAQGALESKYETSMLAIERSEYPDVYDRVICVGAVDQNLNRCSFSNAGQRVDIYAPGQGVYSLLNDGRFGTMDGTSMASPHVAGACADVWSINGGLTGAEVKAIVCGPYENELMSYEYRPYENGNDASILDVDKSVKIAYSIRDGLADKEVGSPQLGVISEYVVDEAGAPLAGVTVHACDSSGALVESADSDHEGHVEIPIAAGVYGLRGEKEGYVCANAADLTGLRVSVGAVLYPKEWIVMRRASASSGGKGQSDYADGFSLIGTWATPSGDAVIDFYSDGTYSIDWFSLGIPEKGTWFAPSQSGDSFPIEMDGSGILQLMQLAYGAADGDYHFEILKNNESSVYLTQVYGKYTAQTSPCKLPLERQ